MSEYFYDPSTNYGFLINTADYEIIQNKAKQENLITIHVYIPDLVSEMNTNE